MRIPALLLLSCACSFGQVYTLDFGSMDYNSLDFTQGDGSFAADYYRNPNAGGFLEIGGLGNATRQGQFLSPVFGPLDLTQGYGSIGDFRNTQVPNPDFDPSRPEGPFNPTHVPGPRIEPRFFLTAAPGVGQAPWQISIYDSDGGRYSFTLTPGNATGEFGQYSATFMDVPEMDWTMVTRIGIAGDGSADLFHAGFKSMTLTAIPEPRVYGVLFGAGLLGLALLRPRVRGRA